MGSNTKSSRGALAIILLVVAFAALGGCVQIKNILQPAPTITPIVTITPTPTPIPPTATPAPTPVTKVSSPDVKVLPAVDKGIIAFDSYPVGDYQRENITIVIANDGAADAKNVVVTLTETDAHDANTLVQQKFNVGDIKRGDRRDFTLVTDEHEQAASVQIKANLEWGENGEYYNPITFIDITKSVLWMYRPP